MLYTRFTSLKIIYNHWSLICGFITNKINETILIRTFDAYNRKFDHNKYIVLNHPQFHDWKHETMDKSNNLISWHLVLTVELVEGCCRVSLYESQIDRRKTILIYFETKHIFSIFIWKAVNISTNKQSPTYRQSSNWKMFSKCCVITITLVANF